VHLVSINVDSQNPETNIKTNLNKQIPRTEQSLDNNRDQTLEMAISIPYVTIFHCSLGRSHKTCLTVVSYNDHPCF
jgi:hypothetical protein